MTEDLDKLRRETFDTIKVGLEQHERNELSTQALMDGTWQILTALISEAYTKGRSDVQILREE